ncbi:MAG: NAD-binding protein [Chloroflexaceae bacterium]|jgi:Trk K+ transport system NAD-binding subunit|nr:NAD-binding protein [Chloroflexaceae bacterium]
MTPTASEDELRLERLRKRRRGYPLWRVVLASIWDLGLLLRESWVALLGFSLLSAVNTLYLLFIYHDYDNSGISPFTFVAAVYETIRMLVLQSGLPLPQNDPLGVLLFFITPLLGLALVFQSVLNFGRLLLDKGSRREAWQVALASTFRQHVIVCGLGRVSYRVALQLLEAGYEVVVIEKNWSTEFLSTMLGLKVPVVLGDAREPTALRQAGALRARGLIAGINDDLLNVEIALSARRLRPDINVVLRIFNQELDTNLERALGRNSAFSSSALAAPTLAAAAVSRAVVHVLPLPDGLLAIAEVIIQPNSQLAGFSLQVEETFHVRVLRHRDAKGREQPTGFMSKLESGDVVLLLGALDALEQVRRRNQPGNKLEFLEAVPAQRPTRRFTTVIVCGLGKIGSRMVRVLQQSQPRPEIVVICQADTEPRLLDEMGRIGVRVIIGDARDPAVLAEAGVERATAVAAVISHDLTNLQIGLAARRTRADVHLVLRVFSDLLAERLATLFGIYTTFSASALAAPTLAAATVLPQVDYAVDIGDKLYATITRSVVPVDQFSGRTITQVRTQSGMLVIAVRRNGVRLLPLPLETQLLPGDEIVVFDRIDALARLGVRG